MFHARAKMRAMPTKPAPDQVCGNCRKYEPSRDDAKYGYCKPREQLAAEGRYRNPYSTTGCLVDVSTPCFMVRWDGMTEEPSFEAKAGCA